MTEDDEKRLAEIRATIAGDCKVGWWVDGDLAFLLRLLDTERAERARVEEECAELNGIFELQCTRMAEATLRWREATGEHAVSPDLGHLLAWLMLTADLATAQQEQAESALAAARERVETITKAAQRVVDEYIDGHEDLFDSTDALSRALTPETP